MAVHYTTTDVLKYLPGISSQLHERGDQQHNATIEHGKSQLSFKNNYNLLTFLFACSFSTLSADGTTILFCCIQKQQNIIFKVIFINVGDHL